MSTKLISCCMCLGANLLTILGIVYNVPLLERIGGVFLAFGVGYMYAL